MCLEINHHKRQQASALYCQMVHGKMHHTCPHSLAVCSIHFLSPAKAFVKTALWSKSCIKNQNKGICWQLTQTARAKKHTFTHVHAMYCVRQTLGSGLGFIREMHSIAISGKHILPCTYPLIALLLHKGKIDGCIFDAVYFFN